MVVIYVVTEGTFGMLPLVITVGITVLCYMFPNDNPLFNIIKAASCMGRVCAKLLCLRQQLKKQTIVYSHIALITSEKP